MMPSNRLPVLRSATKRTASVPPTRVLRASVS